MQIRKQMAWLRFQSVFLAPIVGLPKESCGFREKGSFSENRASGLGQALSQGYTRRPLLPQVTLEGSFLFKVGCRLSGCGESSARVKCRWSGTESVKDVTALLRLLGNASFAEMDRTGRGRYRQRSPRIPGQLRRLWKGTRQGSLSRGHPHKRHCCPGFSRVLQSMERALEPLGVAGVCYLGEVPRGILLSHHPLSPPRCPGPRKCQVWVA